MDTLRPDLTKRDILRYVSDELFDAMFEVPGEEIVASLAGSSGQTLRWARLACVHLNGYGYAGTGLTPQERFNAIITHSKPDHVPLLDKMYTFTLEITFRKERPSQQNLGLARWHRYLEPWNHRLLIQWRP